MCLGNINKIKKISLWLTPWPLLNLYYNYFDNEREAPKLAATICDPAQIKVCSGGLGGPTVWGRLEVEVGATHTDTDGELQLISTHLLKSQNSRSWEAFAPVGRNISRYLSSQLTSTDPNFLNFWATTGELFYPWLCVNALIHFHSFIYKFSQFCTDHIIGVSKVVIVRIVWNNSQTRPQGLYSFEAKIRFEQLNHK